MQLVSRILSRRQRNALSRLGAKARMMTAAERRRWYDTVVMERTTKVRDEDGPIMGTTELLINGDVNDEKIQDTVKQIIRTLRQR